MAFDGVVLLQSDFRCLKAVVVIMTKKRFISAISRRLCFSLPREELKKVRHDYEKTFSSGLASGKSEEDILREIGSPSLAAAEYLSSAQTAVETKHKYIRVIIALIILAIWILYEIFLFFSPYKSFNEPYFLLYSIVFPTMLILLLGGSRLLLNFFSIRKPKKSFLAAVILIPLLLWLIPCFLMKDMTNSFIAVTYSSDFWQWLFSVGSRNFSAGSCLIILFVIAGISAIAFFSILAVKHGTQFVPLIYAQFLAMYAVTAYICFITNMGDPSYVIPEMNRIDVSVLIAAAAFIIIYFAAIFLYKQVKKNTLKDERACSKTEFLSILSGELIFEIPFSQLKKIKADYTILFDEAAVNGKSEKDITYEIGPPRLVAEEILSERQYLKQSKTENKMLRIATISGLLILIIIFEIIAMNCGLFNYIFPSEALHYAIYAIMLPIVILFILNARKLVPAKISLKGMGSAYLIGLVFFLIAWLLPSYICYELSYSFVTDTYGFWISLPIFDLGYTKVSAIVFFLWALYAIAVIGILASCILTIRHGIRLAPLIFIETLGLYRVSSFALRIIDMVEPEKLLSSTMEKNTVIAATIIIIIVASFIAYLAHKYIIRILRRYAE